MAYCLAPRIYKPSKNSDTIAGRYHHREGLSEAIVHLLIILNYDDRDSITLCFSPHYDIGRRDILHVCIRRLLLNHSYLLLLLSLSFLLFSHLFMGFFSFLKVVY